MSRRGLAARYFALCKPRVVALIVFTAFAGMLLAVDGPPPWPLVAAAVTGIALAAAAASALNHLIDIEIDRRMARTRGRPLPCGEVSPRAVTLFAACLALLSMLLLYFRVNPLTAVLTFASLIGYAFVYTVYLKHATPQNIVIGGLAGAAPPLLGWSAMSGTIDPHALLLVLIVFVWTPPHFWALAIHRRGDYAAAGVPMLPVTHGVPFTRWQILFYTVLLVIASLLPWLTGMSGLFYLGGTLVLDAGFLLHAVSLFKSRDDDRALMTFGFSVIYLAVLFIFMLIDHYLPAAWNQPLTLPYGARLTGVLS